MKYLELNQVNDLFKEDPSRTIFAYCGKHKFVLTDVKDIREDFVQYPTVNGLKTRKDYYISFTDNTYARYRNPKFSLV